MGTDTAQVTQRDGSHPCQLPHKGMDAVRLSHTLKGGLPSCRTPALVEVESIFNVIGIIPPFLPCGVPLPIGYGSPLRLTRHALV